jgi:Spy/CpxP family protein refolding chaperone
MQTLKKIGLQSRPLMVLATLVLLFAAAALAQGQGEGSGFGKGKGFGGRGFGPEQRLEILAEKLELTEEQIAAIEGIKEAGREKGTELHKEMMRLRNELEGEMLKDEPSEKAALDLVTRIGSLRTEIQAEKLKTRLEIRQQLTPEQRDKMLLVGERFQGRHGRGGRGMGWHGDRDCERSDCRRGHRGARGW